MSADSQEIQALRTANREQLGRLRQEMEESLTQFVLTELDLGITFCEVARSTNDPDKKARNIGNAWKGYRAALHFSKTPGFDMQNNTTFRDKLANLKALLQKAELTPVLTGS